MTAAAAASSAASMLLEKAMIVPLEGSTKNIPIPCLFNPEKYSISKSTSYKDDKVAGLDAPIYQFIHGNARTLSMQLFFDTYEMGVDVRLFTARLSGLMKVSSDLHRPPLAMFSWGLLLFKGFVESVNTTYTMFSRIGLPVRATCDVKFTEAKSLKRQLTETPRSSPDVTKIRTVTEGDALWSIAAREYEDPEQWRLIAEANGIDDPRDIEPGQRLRIPPLE